MRLKCYLPCKWKEVIVLKITFWCWSLLCSSIVHKLVGSLEYVNYIHGREHPALHYCTI